MAAKKTKTKNVKKTVKTASKKELIAKKNIVQGRANLFTENYARAKNLKSSH